MTTTLAQTDPPLSPAMLDRLVLHWRRDAPTIGTGAHQRRRKGHSLEFRDYRAWQRGDDIRNVDWRASLRQPRRDDLLLRSYEAEERLALAIVVDNRPTMALPEAMPRLLYALWAARALVTLALDKGNEVILARLCAGSGETVLVLRGAGAKARAREWCETLWRQRDEASDSFANPDRFLEQLRPAGAVVLISDMLFEDPSRQMPRFAHLAQRRQRSLSVLQLDSVKHEIGLLRAAQKFHLVRDGQEAGNEMQLFDEAAMLKSTDAIAAHLQDLRHALHAGGLDWPQEPVVWPMPEASDGPAALERLKSHFAQTFPRLPLLAGLTLGGRG
jgi:uncharacterized protein (DUF58 family)